MLSRRACKAYQTEGDTNCRRRFRAEQAHDIYFCFVDFHAVKLQNYPRRSKILELCIAGKWLFANL